MRSGTIGVCADEVWRYTAAAVSLFSTRTSKDWTIRVAMGRNIAKNCNRLAKHFVGDLLWMQSDDHVWNSDTLERLEAHQKDVVVPLMLMRQKPFHPVIFEKENEGGFFEIMQDPPHGELIEVEAAGTGGMLISREAFEKVGDTPFSFQMLEENGEILGEDLAFCKKLKKAGIKIYCDTSVYQGHISGTAVWPDWSKDEGWQVRLDLNSGAK